MDPEAIIKEICKKYLDWEVPEIVHLKPPRSDRLVSKVSFGNKSAVLKLRWNRTTEVEGYQIAHNLRIPLIPRLSDSIHFCINQGTWHGLAVAYAQDGSMAEMLKFTLACLGEDEIALIQSDGIPGRIKVFSEALKVIYSEIKRLHKMDVITCDIFKLGNLAIFKHKPCSIDWEDIATQADVGRMPFMYDNDFRYVIDINDVRQLIQQSGRDFPPNFALKLAGLLCYKEGD